MKNFKKIMGIILVLCLVITQFPIAGNKVAKAATETKTTVTSSKLSFDYEKVKQETATTFKYCDKEVDGFNGNGDYEITHEEGVYGNGDGYQNIGYFKSDAEYTLKNVILTVNGTYEFLLKDTIQAGKNSDGVYEVAFLNMWSGQPEGTVLYKSKDEKATLVSGGNNVPIYLNVLTDDTQPDDGDNNQPGGGDDNNQPENPGTGDDNKPQEPDNTKTEIKSSKLSFKYEKAGEGEVTGFKFYDTDVNGFNGNGDYEIEHAEWMYNNAEKGNGYENIGDFKSDAGYVLKNVILIINGTYEFLLEEEKYSYYNEGEKANKADLANIWGGYKKDEILYTSKDGKATLVFDGTLISLHVSNKADDSDNTGILIPL